MIEIVTKKCRKCEEVKPLFEFHTNRASFDKHTVNCKECAKKIRKEQPSEHQKIRQRHRELFPRTNFNNPSVP